MKKKTGHPMFGSVLKGYRLGFAFSSKHGAFIRMTPVGNLCRLEAVPSDQGAKAIPNGVNKELHVCWWDEPELLDLVEPLKGIKRVRKAFTIYLDDDGKRVSSK